MNLKKIVSAFLCVLFLLSEAALPAAMAAAADSVTVTVLYADGEKIRPFFDLTVSDGTAEAYGYSVTDQDHNGKAVETVTVMDAIVCAHAKAFGSAYSAQTTDAYFYVSDGYAMSAFGESKILGFSVNDKTPHDDILISSEGGSYYTGYAIDEARIQDGDVIVLYTYQDTTAWTDMYPIFSQKDLSLTAGETTTVTVTGYSIGFYGSSEQSEIDANTVPLAGASLAWTKDFETYTEAGTVGEKGVSEITAPEEGNWYLVARGKSGKTPVIAGVCKATVQQKTPADSRFFPILALPTFSYGNAVLTLGFKVRYHDFRRQSADFTRFYTALRICFDRFPNLFDFVFAWD